MKMKLEVAHTGNNFTRLPLLDLAEQKQELLTTLQKTTKLLGFKDTQSIQIVLTGTEKEYLITIYQEKLMSKVIKMSKYRKIDYKQAFLELIDEDVNDQMWDYLYKQALMEGMPIMEAIDEADKTLKYINKDENFE